MQRHPLNWVDCPLIKEEQTRRLPCFAYVSAISGVLGLEECRASFEASLREAPQDEVFILMPSTTCLMTRSGPARPSGVSKHALPSAVRFLTLRSAHPTRPRPSLHGIVTALLHACCIIEP